jgi:hypothetical protein
MAIWNVLLAFGIFYDHLVHFVLIWYIFTILAPCPKEKSGNPGWFNPESRLLVLTNFEPGI